MSGDGSNALVARLGYPTSLAVDGAGNLYIGEYYDIRKVNAAGIISTIAGNGTSLVDGVTSVDAPIGYPVGLAVDASGNLYIADPSVKRVRVITGSTIKTVAGTGTFGFSGDGGPASAALLDEPASVAVDAAGNLYIGDEYNLRVRKVDTKGVITTVAGKSHFAGDGGPAPASLMHLPVHAISDAAGNVYISDNDNHRLRKVSPSGTITTIAGTGICGFSGDVTQAASTPVCYPNSLLLEQSGSLDFADSGNGILRRISPSGLISTFAGTGVYGDSGDGNPAVFAQFKAPTDSRRPVTATSSFRMRWPIAFAKLPLPAPSRPSRATARPDSPAMGEPRPRPSRTGRATWRSMRRATCTLRTATIGAFVWLARMESSPPWPRQLLFQQRQGHYQLYRDTRRAHTRRSRQPVHRALHLWPDRQACSHG